MKALKTLSTLALVGTIASCGCPKDAPKDSIKLKTKDGVNLVLNSEPGHMLKKGDTVEVAHWTRFMDKNLDGNMDEKESLFDYQKLNLNSSEEENIIPVIGNLKDKLVKNEVATILEVKKGEKKE